MANILLSVEEAKKFFPGYQFDDIDSLLNEKNSEEHIKAHLLLLQQFEKDKSNTEILWRLAKVNHILACYAGEKGDTEKKKALLNQGLEYAEQCLHLSPRSADAHKWYAICIGDRSQFQGTKTKIRDGLIFKKHIEEGLSLTPNDPTLNHLLGRFKFEISSLTWMEKKFVATFYEEMPQSTFNDALKFLLKAEELCVQPWKENKLLIAKCYVGVSEYAIALDWLDKAKEVLISTPEDKAADVEIDLLLKRYDSYRETNN